MFRWTALIAAVVLVISLAGIMLSSKQSAEPRPQQTTEKTHEKDDPKKNEVALFDRWFPDSQAVFNLFLALFTGLLFFVGVIQLNLLNRAETIAANTAQAAKDSADVAKETLVSANRPWIAADIKIASDLTFGAPAAAQMTFEYVLKNTGNTPGISVEIYPKLILIEFGKVGGNPPNVVIQSITTDPPAVLLDLCDLARTVGDAKLPGQSIRGDAIFPGGQITDRVTLQLSAEEIERAKQSSFYKVINPVLLVCVNYKSPLEKTSHQTGYIFAVFTNDPAHPNGIDPGNGNISIKNLGLTRTFSNSFAN